jgi:hypothetical protein
MMRDHARIEELLAVRSLGGLDGDDARTLDDELQEHGPDCAECRRLEREFSETAAMLAASLEPQPVDDTIVDRIVRSTEQVSAGPERATPRAAGPATEDELTHRRASKRRRVWQGLIGVAASIALIVAGFEILTSGSQPITSTKASDHIVRFQGDHGDLALVYDPGEPGAIVIGTGIADPGPNNVYELWTFDGKTPVRAGCMAPVDGAMASTLPGVTPTETMAVTVESNVCPDAPAGDVAFTASLA